MSDIKKEVAASDESVWELHYWPLLGRGEFVRLLFEEAGVPYKEINDPEVIAKVYKFKTADQEGFPCHSVPVIAKGNPGSLGL